MNDDKKPHDDDNVDGQPELPAEVHDATAENADPVNTSSSEQPEGANAGNQQPADNPPSQEDTHVPNEAMQTIDCDLTAAPVAEDEKATVDEVDLPNDSQPAAAGGTIDDVSILPGGGVDEAASSTLDNIEPAPPAAAGGTIDDVSILPGGGADEAAPPAAAGGTIDDVSILPGGNAGGTLDDVSLIPADANAGGDNATASPVDGTIDDESILAGLGAAPGGDSPSSINQTLDSVDIPPGTELPANTGGQDGGSKLRFDQTLDSVDEIAEGVNQTLDSTELPQSGVLEGRVDQTVDSSEFSSAVIDQLQQTHGEEPVGLPSQTLDSVDLPTAPIIDPGTQPQRAGQQTVDSVDFGAPPVEGATDKPSTVGESHAGGTLDSAMISAEHIQATWEGVSGEHIAPQTSIRAEVIEAQESDDSLFIQTRAFHDPQRGGKAQADYEIEKVLGEGGMGVVYMARQASISRTVAVKMLKGETAQNETQRNKFLSEAVVTGDLEHPNIVPIYDVGMNEDGALFYSMKRVQGTPWMDVIGEKSVDENLGILMKVADAIGFAHDRKVIHRDLKPENVMLGGFGEVLVMDWGLAVPSDGRKFGGIKQSVSMGGTPAYMAPEMAAGPFEKIGLASDIYLLGAMLYEIVTGRPPHTGKDVMKCLFAAAKNEIQPSSKKGELVDIALKAMATNPADRYPTVPEFQLAIKQYLSHSESIALSNRAEEDLAKARQTHDYEDFARARFGYAEAYELWPGNRTARDGYQQASLEYATTAHTKGDYDLGLQLLEDDAAGHNDVRDKIQLAQTEREARQQRLKTLRWVSMSGLAVFLAVVCGFSVALWSWMSEAQIARAEAVVEKERAIEQEGIAKAKELEAKNALIETERQRKLALVAKQAAEREKIKADKSANEAIAAQAVAETERAKATKSAMEANTARQVAESEKVKANNSAIEALAAKKAAEKEKLKADKSAQEALAAKAVAEQQKMKADISAQLALKAQKTAEMERVKADISAKEAIAARKVSEEAKEAAVLAEKVAQQQKVRAVEAADEAERQKQEALRQGYVATIGLAAAKIEENAFESAEELLLGLDPSLQNWEWGRLMFLCKQGIASIAADRRIDAVAFQPAPAGVRPAHFIAGGWGGVATIWNTSSTGQPRHILNTGGEFVNAVAYSPDGAYVATGSDNADGYVMIWNAATGERTATIQGHEGRVTSVEFSNDGKSLLTGSSDRTARIFDIASGRETAKFFGHLMGVWDATFSPDNRKVATASQDGSALVWDVATGDASPRFQSHQGPVYSAAFSPDGASVVTAGADKRVLMWQPGELVEFDFNNAVQSFEASGSAAQRNDDTKFVVMGAGSKIDQHSGAVHCVKFSADGSLIVSSGHDNTIKLWQPSGALIKTLRGHGSWVRSSDVSADGNLVLSGGYDESHQIRLWDVDKYVEQGQVLAGHESEILAASFSSDGEQVLTASRDRTVKSWDFASGLPKLTFTEGHKFLASRAEFLPGDQELITSAVDNTTRLWNVATGAQTGQFNGTGLSATVAVSPDGKLLVTGAEGSNLKIWDIASRKLLSQLEGHKREVTTAAFAADGKRLVSGDAGGLCILWDVESREMLFELKGHTGRINDAAFLPDGAFVLTASSDSTVSVWDASSGREIKSRVMSHPRGVRAIGVTPDGKQLLTASEDGRLRLWEFERRRKIWEKTLSGSGATVAENVRQRMNARGLMPEQLLERARLTTAELSDLLNPRTPADQDALSAVSRVLGATVESLGSVAINSVSISSSGRQALIAGKRDKTVRLIQVGSGDELMTTASNGSKHHFIEFNSARELSAATYSHDGLKVATVGGAEAAVWSRTTGNELMSYNAHGPVISANFDSTRRRVVTGSTDNSARVWDAVTGKDLQKLTGHTAPVNSAVFTPDDRYVLTSSNDGSAILWDPSNGEKRMVFKAPQSGAVSSAVFANDGKTILTASADGKARIWSVVTGKVVQTFAGVHKDGLLSAAFSRDNSLIVTASRDNTAVVWSTRDGKPIQTLGGHTAAVTAAAFSADGARVLTASEDYTAKLWHMGKGKEILTLKGHTQEVTDVSFSRDGQYALTGSKDGTARVWLAQPWGHAAAKLTRSKAHSNAGQGSQVALQQP